MKAGPDKLEVINLMEHSESSASQIVLPKKRTTAQELQARRQARQAARKMERSQMPTVATSGPGITAEENAFWGGEGTPPSLSSFARTLDSAGESSTPRSDTNTDADDTETPESLQTVDTHASDLEPDTETGEDEGEGDVTVVLQSKEQSQPRRTFSLLRQSTTVRGAITPRGPSATPAFSEVPPVPVPVSVPVSVPAPRTVTPERSVSSPVVAEEQRPASPPVVSSPPREPSPIESETRHDASTSSNPFDVTSPEVELQMVRVCSHWFEGVELIGRIIAGFVRLVSGGPLES